MDIVNKSILVTGGAGFIGSHIVNKLASINTKRIRIVDNLSTGCINNVSNLLNNNVEFVYGDITNLEVCRHVCKDIDIVCHQAAIGSVPRSVKDPLLSHNNNVNGFLNLLIACNENNIKRVVYASSSSVYGDNDTLPKIEHNTGSALSPYAATKQINEIYANVFCKCYNMELIGLRYFNIFGERQQPNGEYAAVIPKFINALINNTSPVIYGDGSYSRDFTYVDNAVYANILALSTTNKDCFNNVFNIGCGGQISILDLFREISQNINSSIQPLFKCNRIGDIPHSNASIDKAIALLDYEPIISFKEGIKKTIASYI
jgi:UDP-N-acetylglucosamine/UDP-N-acetylgalactosamine 4-epimerase